MPLFRRDEGAPPRRFRIREKLLAVGDDSWIEDESGERVLRVDGKVARLRATWVIEDRDRREVARVREKRLALRDTMTVDLAGGGGATVRRSYLWRRRFKVKVDGGPDLTAKGHILDHEYELERDGDTVASISRSWFRVRDTYGVEVRADIDPLLVLAVTVALDGLTHRDD